MELLAPRRVLELDDEDQPERNSQSECPNKEEELRLPSQGTRTQLMRSTSATATDNVLERATEQEAEGSDTYSRSDAPITRDAPTAYSVESNEQSTDHEPLNGTRTTQPRGAQDLDLNALPGVRQALPIPNHSLAITWKHNIFAYRTPRRLKPVSRLWLLLRGVIIWNL